MIIGSHNSWSYLRPKKWWHQLIAFTGRCQRIGIAQQYQHHNVRCFDLRIRTDRYAYPHVCHGIFEYNITPNELQEGLEYLNSCGDCYVRVIHEARTKSQYTDRAVDGFIEFCRWAERKYPFIHFWCGRNLYNWQYDYIFADSEPTFEEKYSSVCPPKILDDWFPWLYAWIHNPKNISQGTDKDILLVDYVDIK